MLGVSTILLKPAGGLEVLKALREAFDERTSVRKRLNGLDG